MNANVHLWTPATAYDRLWTRRQRLHPTDFACTVEGGAEQSLPKVSDLTPRSTGSIKIMILGVETRHPRSPGLDPRGFQSSEDIA